MDTSEIVNTIFLGEVLNVHNYGAFVQIPGRREQGLVHRSQISSASVDDASEVLQRGDRVWCKVIEITDDGKVSLSMKVVQQGSGKDLDPTGVQIHQDKVRRMSQPQSGGRRAIKLEAVLNTTCSKCGTRGHLANNCFQSRGGKTYELLPEEDDEEDEAKLAEDLEKAKQIKREEKRREKEERRRKKKAKKEKKAAKKAEKKEKKAKKKRSRSTSSESSSSSSESEEEPKKKKRKRDRSKDRSHSKRSR
ncbi:nucleolar protein of 40 kDa [Nilaparvata lugens]|uniref:nucleolar protein of 40 kDa n=1 Tax=Nilaparvata lugens TaxID=108931 RepID=UPI00193E5FA2|nr:nucleolar protein of 40 kDa [Nilaparvata lugens]